MSKLLNTTDLLILSKIPDLKLNIGICEVRGMTKYEIKERTDFSLSTINRTIKKLLELNYIAEGIRQSQKSAYYITKEGSKKLDEVQIIRFKED